MTAMDVLCRMDASRLFGIEVYSKDGDYKFSGTSETPIHDGKIDFDDFIDDMPTGDYLETWQIEDGDTIKVSVTDTKAYRS